MHPVALCIAPLTRCTKCLACCKCASFSYLQIISLHILLSVCSLHTNYLPLHLQVHSFVTDIITICLTQKLWFKTIACTKYKDQPIR